MQRGGLRWEESIAELCRQEGIAQGLYYKWSKDFLEAGKKRLAGDITRQANSSEVKELKSEARELKECVAELTLECPSSYSLAQIMGQAKKDFAHLFV